ncbi:glycosyltransferase family 4 protein [Paraclostridium tenue]|uniref:Glycosyl transferase family 1 domain-containing protein n=1 Tax=Paraclostridium tenue TaxID=1737 RepID=A0ABN1LWY8_9FIRM
MDKNKISIYYASKLRGFIKHIVENPPTDIEYVYTENNFYETSSKFKLVLKKLLGGKIGDSLGLILKLNVDNNECDIVQTYNRFIKSSQNYIIMLENPTAIYHYSLNRSKTLLGKRKINTELNRGYLKSIVCTSKACYSTVDLLIQEMPESIIKEQIYPYVPDNTFINEKFISERSYSNELKCLFISSDFKLKSGCEVIEAFEKLNSSINIELTIVTKKSSIPTDYLEKIKNIKNINLLEFNLKYEELQSLYTSNMVLLHTTRQDSTPMVVLEAIKSGMVVLATDLYAIPEMVEDTVNGYLVKPKYRFFNENNLPNPNVWNNRKETIYSSYIDNNIVDFIYEKITYLSSNRDILEEMSKNSYEKATRGEFSESFIKKKWENLYKKIMRELK